MAGAKANILVVDDELSMRELLDVMLSREGYKVACAEDGTQALSMLGEMKFDLVLCDVRLGDMSGIDVLKAAKKANHDTVVIMISAYATTEVAVAAMNEGAYDFVPKPLDSAELKQTIIRSLSLRTVEQERQALDNSLEDHLYFERIVGSHPKMKHIYNMVRQVAQTRTRILITGESGTGKELIARAIHEQSDRANHPFVVVNCGGIPENLMESELFGHRKGSFTGAVMDKKGLFTIAHKGTIFLDEIGELSMPLQVKLLRVVQDGAFKQVGGTEEISVDARILSATNKNLSQEVIDGNFREDLFYRLNVIELNVPPLRERKSDIRVLAQFFVEKFSKDLGKEVIKLSSYALDMLEKYSFPGNVRELENLIERSVALSTTNIILPESLSLAVHKRRWIEGVPGRRFDLEEVTKGVALDEILADIERAYLKKALESSGGNKNRAAELLGISFRSFRYRLDKLNVPWDEEE
ncbi:sigma-54-dependent transcriptional regulator [Desulfosudis oleivorans]|uniref:Two component, sigma54 specific, transcriptional regulator, Fis family n=1 Tax=Desulfosudis oleivorans (strain DSM 6200 / JCM 39069 / Hxd3) TaxID=96561 RepID=A8ZU14_DESOH|nr:sigma-54 dependent transcriptional regulator [Desulfosudis oleivorans]ABW66326.1 two component, sigma54 specific, transcriptional regulator, Fis family [Desulfosudis oleivorans Hxd3]